MWNGKNKAITLSFDDGVKQDIRLLEILNKYGLKSTFNLNSARLGLVKTAADGEKRDVVKASQVRDLYAGHEVAVHTLTHPNLKELDEETIIRQVEEDREKLSSLCGYEVVGMAYPFGDADRRVADIIEKNTGVKYARTVTSTMDFRVQKDDLLLLNPSFYWGQHSAIETAVDSFLALKTDEPQVLYIWGHSYELDMKELPINWEWFETLCEKISKREDIFYGTNKEIFIINGKE